MKLLHAALCLSLFARSASAAQDADPTLTNVARSAEQQLAKSVAELDALRAQIAAEKLPLSQELTRLEDTLSERRREHERVTRQVDAVSLELTGIKSRTKAHQDELAYVGNLLDEYARTFETRVNVGELQYCGDAIEEAKGATENTTLSLGEKLARQLALVDLTIRRIADSIGGLRFPGVAVDLQGGVVKGRFAIVGPVALFRGDAGGATGLAIAQGGSTKPLVRPLDEPFQSGIAALVDGGSGLLPLDPSRGAALKALVQKTNILHVFEKGGPIMWPLLVASILALATVIERLVFLARERMKREPKALDAFFTCVTRGDTRAAIEVADRTRFYVVRALGYALKHKEQSLPNALLYAQAQEMKRFRRWVAVLDTVITLAPLLGLLGTVTGMMSSFKLIGGDLGAPGAITGGIAEALIATAFGLGIAITALLPFNFLNARMEEAQHEIESASAQLELLVRASEPVPSAPLPVQAARGPRLELAEA